MPDEKASNKKGKDATSRRRKEPEYKAKARRYWEASAKDEEARVILDRMLKQGREAERPRAWTREVIEFANFEFGIGEPPSHSGDWMQRLNWHDYEDFLKKGKPYPRGGQAHLGKLVRKVQEHPGGLWSPLSDEEIQLHKPSHTDVRLLRKRDLTGDYDPSPYRRSAPVDYVRGERSPHTEPEVRSLLEYQKVVRNILSRLASGLLGITEDDRLIRVTTPGTYPHALRRDLEEMRSRKEKVGRCACGNFFLKEPPQRKHCSPKCASRHRMRSHRSGSQTDTPKRRNR